MSKLTEKQRETVLKSIKEGLGIFDSHQLEGFRKKQTEKLLNNSEWRDKCEKAVNHFKAEQLSSIKRQSGTKWQASAWLLERRFNEEFGLKTKTEVSTNKPDWLEQARIPSSEGKAKKTATQDRQNLIDETIKHTESLKPLPSDASMIILTGKRHDDNPNDN